MRIALSSLAAAILIVGCGYKGPLYLPKPKPAAQQPAPATPTQPDASKSGEGATKE
jgi:predicted small lipoprotein YifL